MTVLRSQLRTDSDDFRVRYAHNKKLATELHARQHAARNVRPERDLQRLAKLGKMTARQRLDKLLDPATPFLELST
ncbi:methylcrotonoyl-CoA carboxylase, partial [Salmonella enterica subsp. enterica serovar Enteritidis]|nr:methylcrotonoyl-CoA carboxylase [Salmonella enterica subsp. enterica serovar Enteritidis]